MPIGRYIAWVGASLIALLFAVDWYLPNSPPEPADEAVNRPVIRIASIQQPPERIVFDTNQPTIVPPPTLFAEAAPDQPSPIPSYAPAVSPPAAVNVDQKKSKVTKRQEPKIAHKPPLSITPTVATSSPPATAPLTQLSLMDFISKQLGRNLFNLN
jgi:hypothetical protein